MPTLSAGCISPRPCWLPKAWQPTFRVAGQAHFPRLLLPTRLPPPPTRNNRCRFGTRILATRPNRRTHHRRSIRGLEATGHLHPRSPAAVRPLFPATPSTSTPNQGIAWTASVQTSTDLALTKPTGTSPHKTRPPSAMPTVRIKSIPTAATSAATSPNWHICRPPLSTRRGPPPTTSTHTAIPFPRPSETYVHTKKPH